MDERAALPGDFGLRQPFEPVGDRSRDQIGEQYAPERRDERGRHRRADQGGIGHVREHAHQPEYGRAHPHRGGGVREVAPEDHIGGVTARACVERFRRPARECFGIAGFGELADRLAQETAGGRDTVGADDALGLGDLLDLADRDHRGERVGFGVRGEEGA